MELRHGDAQAGGTGFAMQACVPSGARTPSVSFAIFAPTYPEGIGLQNQGLQVRVLLGSSNLQLKQVPHAILEAGLEPAIPSLGGRRLIH